jgi:hypothetical protein
MKKILILAIVSMVVVLIGCGSNPADPMIKTFESAKSITNLMYITNVVISNTTVYVTNNYYYTNIVISTNWKTNDLYGNAVVFIRTNTWWSGDVYISNMFVIQSNTILFLKSRCNLYFIGNGSIYAIDGGITADSNHTSATNLSIIKNYYGEYKGTIVGDGKTRFQNFIISEISLSGDAYKYRGEITNNPTWGTIRVWASVVSNCSYLGDLNIGYSDILYNTSVVINSCIHSCYIYKNNGSTTFTVSTNLNDPEYPFQYVNATMVTNGTNLNIKQNAF